MLDGARAYIDSAFIGGKSELALSVRERNLRGARIGAALAAVLMPAGAGLDWITSKDLAVNFLVARLIAAALCGALLAWSFSRAGQRHPEVIAFSVVMICAVAFEYMIQRLGGFASPYYAAIMQLILAIGVLVYWTPAQAAAACTALVGVWLVPALVEGPTTNLSAFMNNFYSLTICALIAGVSIATRHRSVLREQESRAELAATSGELSRALEQARQVDKVKSEFFANISHELRTPLTLILSPVDELIAKLRPSAERDALKVVRRNATRLLRMIDDLLDLARLEGGGLRLRVTQVDVGALAERTVENAKDAAAASGIELTCRFEGDAPEVFGDPHRLEIILTNLIGNAIKFTPSGGCIDVLVVHNQAGTSVEVSDTGPGIPKEERERIFDRFHQTETSERRRQGGVGIGLALARELAQLHGGSLTVDSQVGIGSTFTLFLKGGQEHFHTQTIERRQIQLDSHPGRRVEDSNTAIHTRSLEHATAELRQSQRPPERVVLDRGRLPRVLVVEDEDDLRGFIVGVLKEVYIVDGAKDGAEALSRLQQNRPDLVLTDVMMPGTSGLDLCRAIKDDPGLRHIPVILLTARGESEAALEGYEAGADDFVSKPFHTQVLLARIRAHLKMRGLSLQLADQARLASAGTLAAGLAHEVKNPLNAAVNAARILEQGGSSRVSNEKLMGLIIDALERINGIVSALDAHARPADGDDLRPCDVRKSVESTLNLLAHKLRDRVVVHENYGVTGDVFAPARAFNQVLLNLIDNSIRSGAANIWIEVRQADKQISVAVSDDGPGVPADVVHRIFDPFFTTRVEGEGTGLGLHLSRRIAQECGGELRYEPRPGGGARFVMEIPAMEQAA
ncbi:MAG: ATP-binding protein [Polyangiales bacterium]